jgi:tripartite-type tricarboxylate transporter receptor subunit TctC
VVERLNTESLAVLARSDVRTRFDEFGGTPGTMTASQFADFVRGEFEIWGPVVRASGASAD